ncbi:MAG: pyridoxamine 5'-phosphate oxidase family protein [Methanocorpusculum sp.]|nr:pyridoxamine 5'-phosphate oxidase family protein [Methanocorpusculum sp.]
MKKSIVAVIGLSAVLCLVIFSAGCVSTGDQSGAPAGDETVISQYIADYIPQVQTVQLATASASGVPNVATMSAVMTDGNRIIIGNGYMNKTLANLQENPQAAVLAWNSDGGYCLQFKGTAEIKTDTEEHILMKELVEKKFGDSDFLKNVVVITVTEVYNSMLGEDAGQRLA